LTEREKKGLPKKATSDLKAEGAKSLT